MEKVLATSDYSFEKYQNESVRKKEEKQQSKTQEKKATPFGGMGNQCPVIE